MATQISVEIDKTSLDRVKLLLNTLNPSAVDTAIRRAANDTAGTAKSRAVKKVAGVVTLTQKTVRKFITVQKANYTKPIAKTLFKGAPIELINFEYIAGYAGVISKVRRTGASALYRHRFVENVGGHTAILERGLAGDEQAAYRKKAVPRREPRANVWGSTILPVDKQYGPSVPLIFHHNGEKEIFEDMMTLFQERMIARAEYLLSRA